MDTLTNKYISTLFSGLAQAPY